MSKALDLGCGARPQNPFNADELFGVDLHADPAANVRRADLVVEPIPYADASFDYLTAFHFIEHIPRLVYVPQRRNAFIELMNEIYRVLKPGGYFLSLTAAAPNAAALRDPTQVHAIAEETFTLFFDDVNRRASMDGFAGAFEIVAHEWRGPNIFAILKKVPVPQSPAIVAGKNETVSVFIPVFNGGKYIAETLDSLLQQTLTDFEVICVDDGSTDNSLSILQAYAVRDPRVRVFQTPANLGSAPKVLNYALPFMRGGYFVYSSQDDLFSADWLEKMRTRAIATGADAVIPDLVFYHSAERERNRALVGLHGQRNVELSGRDAIRYSLNWEIPGNALWNAELIKRLGFEEFGLNSDEFSVRVFFLHANKVVFSEGVFYYRQDNEQAVTKKISYRSFDYPHTQLRLYRFLRQNSFPAEILQQEALKVVKLMMSLKRWLVEQGAHLSADHQARAEQRLRDCLAEIQPDPMFAPIYVQIEAMLAGLVPAADGDKALPTA